MVYKRQVTAGTWAPLSVAIPKGTCRGGGGDLIRWHKTYLRIDKQCSKQYKFEVMHSGVWRKCIFTLYPIPG